MTLHRRWSSLFLVLALSPGACTQVGAPAHPAPGPSGPAGASPVLPGTEAGRLRHAVVQTALDVLGTPYVWGGSDANGFDCSGLIQYAYGRHGVSVPRVSSDQVRAGRAVSLQAESLEPGDILGFALDGDGKTSHVGLYIGDGRFIHSGSAGVQQAEIRNPYWRARWVAARRIIG